MYLSQIKNSPHREIKEQMISTPHPWASTRQMLPSYFELLVPYDALSRHGNLVNFDSGQGLPPVSTKPLPE